MATATKKYTLVNLPTNSSGHQNVVQKVYVGTDNIYALQKFGNDSVISRAALTGSSTVDFGASGNDKMTLKNTGHAQTLDWYSYNGKYYFLVAIDPKANENDTEWATQLGRIEYQGGRTINVYTDIERLSMVNYNNAAGTSIGTTLRVEGAISTSHEYLLVTTIRIKDHHARLTYYDLKAVNAALDANIAAGKNYIECTDARIKAAAKSSWETSSSLYGLTPNGSVQGMDLSDGEAIYLSSGNIGEIPAISKSSWKGTFVPKSFALSQFPSKYVETEGIQIKDELYVGISTHFNGETTGNYTTGNYVYSVSKDNW